MRTIYLGAIEPAITYGAAIWGASLTVKQINKLRSVQRISAIGAAAAYKTVSTEALLVIGDLIPIEGKIRETKERWWARESGVINQGDNLINIEKRGTTINNVHPARNMGIRFDEVGSDFNAENVIFTDGSKGENGVGAAIAVYRHEREIDTRKFRLGETCTVFQSELVAIKGAIEYGINHHEEREWHIISDSRSALHALGSMRKPTELMTGIIDLLREGVDTRGNQFFLHWTKAHVGNRGTRERTR